MRYALISDIHGNLEAFQAVLEDLSKHRIDGYLCIGDVIGYGADPKKCIKLVKSIKPLALIAGNHEWGVLDLVALEYFNPLAKRAVIWTKSVLGQGELDFLKSFHLVHEEKNFTLVHGTLKEPEKFYYILNSDDAYFTMKLMKTALCFVGHSHVPAIFYSDIIGPRYLGALKIKIDYDKKYIINVGSIGQPRDGDPRASYAIYDDEEKTIEIKRAAYDIEAAKDKILGSGLPPRLAFRLREGR